jgi:transposase-like protein
MENNNIKKGCINKECPDFGKIDNGNLSIRREVGKNKIKMLRCKTCGKEFSERNGTPLFGLKISPEKIEEVLLHIAEGCGIRATERLTGINRNTVMSISKKVGLHSEKVHNTYVKDIVAKEVQFDEKWSFVGMKDKNNKNGNKKKAHNGIM